MDAPEGTPPDAAARPPTPGTRVRRVPGRGLYARADVDAILDAGYVAHVGIVEAGHPLVIPMVYAREGDRILLHGSRASRLMRALLDGVPVCVTVTLLDALVLARSAFHHSANYRSVVIFGRATAIEDPAERARAFEALVDHVVPGRSADVRMPNEPEDRQTALVGLPLDTATAKIRNGPVKDEEDDYALPIWAGLLPFTHRPQAVVPDDRLDPALDPPANIADWTRPL